MELPRRRSAWATRPLLAVAVLLAALGGIELGFRLFRPVRYLRPDREPGPRDWREILHRASDVPGLAYELAPDQTGEHRGVEIATNSFGLRDEEPRAGHGPGRVRVAALGDSVTFGMGVAQEHTWPEQLERLLNVRDPSRRSWEVLNFGVSGYNARDAALVLRHRALPLEPDVVVYGYFLNDPEVDPVHPLRARFTPRSWWQHSHLLRRLARLLKARDERRAGGDYLRYLHLTDRSEWRGVEAALGALAALSGEHALPVLVAVFPSFRRGASWDDYLYADLHEQVVGAARAAGLEALDLLPAFRGSGRPPRRLSIDNWHPDPNGHRVAAQALVEPVLAAADRAAGVPLDVAGER